MKTLTLQTVLISFSGIGASRKTDISLLYLKPDSELHEKHGNKYHKVQLSMYGDNLLEINHKIDENRRKVGAYGGKR